MRNRSRHGRLVTASIALAAMLLAPTRAEGQYLDPGSASIIVQALVAGVVAVGATLKLYWRNIAGLLSRRRRPGNDSTGR